MNSYFWIFIISTIHSNTGYLFPKTQYRIGGAFSDVFHQAAFQVVIQQINEMNWNESFELVPDSYNVSCYNILDTRRGKGFIKIPYLVYGDYCLAVCTLLNRGVVGIFGPSSPYTSNYIQSICDNKEIPQIETHYDSKVDRNKCVVNLHPHPNEIIEFFVHLVKSYNWNSIIILFEDNESLKRIAPVLELNIEYGVQLIFRELDKDSSGSFREVLSNIKNMPEYNILLECSMDILEEVLRQAQQVGIMNEYYNYIITNLDLATINLEPYQYGGTNITGIRLFDHEDSKVMEMQKRILDMLKLTENQNNHEKLRISTALLIDGINMFNEVLKELVKSPGGIQVQSLGCEDTESWKYGYTIANQIKGREYYGLTRKIEFNFEGFRRNFKLDLIELTNKGVLKVGQWDSSKKVLVATRPYVPPLEETEIEYTIFNKTFKILIVLTAPYAMLKKTTAQLIGNDRFEGFCIDVIQELSALLGFNYTFIVQEDGKNGNFNRSTHQWDGVIRQIIIGNADLGITDLTITSERENAVDFTMPFMNLGISILYKKPEPMPPSLFMFLSPFSTGVWLMLGVAYILVSIAIFIMGRLSPSEWNNPFPCLEDPDYFVNQFTIKNSLWFTIGGLLQQGSELAPISISTRTASGFWWFFVLIIVSSYTANLAAFLTVETLVTPFKNIDELATQSEIKYGAKIQGATESFFRDSNVSTYQKVSNYMKEHPNEMTNENEEGIRRVECENYAFLMESTTIEYVIERHCSLAQVGGLLDDKGYGIAMKKDSFYRNELSTAVIKLQETGILTKLKIKWWKEKTEGGTCSAKSEISEAEALDLKNVGGVFLVLFVGAILAFFGSFIEMLATIYQRTKTLSGTFVHEIKEELNFFIQFKRNIKEVNSNEHNDN